MFWVGNVDISDNKGLAEICTVATPNILESMNIVGLSEVEATGHLPPTVAHTAVGNRKLFYSRGGGGGVLPHIC